MGLKSDRQAVKTLRVSLGPLYGKHCRTFSLRRTGEFLGEPVESLWN